MRSFCKSALTFAAAVVVILFVGGCGSSSEAPVCGNTDRCQIGDLPCSRACGRAQIRVCECGTGTMAGTLVCSDCMAVEPGTGGAVGATGGRTGAGGRTNARTGGAGGDRMPGSGGATATGGRPGRGTGGGTTTGGRSGTGGAAAPGGRMGRGTGGAANSGGAAGPSDAGIGSCPAGVEAGGLTCTASATPICQTACVNALYNICTCATGVWVCPANQIACP